MSDRRDWFVRRVPAGVAALLMCASLHAQSATSRAETALFPLDPAAYVTGRFRPDTTADFVRLPDHITDGDTYHLRSAAARQVERMIHAAGEQGIHLEVVSATRNWEWQKRIWEGKFNGARRGYNYARNYPDTTARCRAILRYSSAPGTSRHHWGTDVDLNSTDTEWWEAPQGRAALKWLQTNGHRFGFVLVYTTDRETGYEYEPWHWSYAPLSRPLLKNYYFKLVEPEDIAGFAAAEAVRRLPWREYVLGVNPVLK